jgi:uncharacterized membrane protein (DUF4010 family)
MPEQKNPTQLRSAILFGLMYAVVIFALAAARAYFKGNDAGPMYLVAGLSGLTDMDAITLSAAQMANTDPAMAADGWRLILVAAMANLVAKACLAGILGNRRLLWLIAALFLAPLAGGILLVWLA